MVVIPRVYGHGIFHCLEGSPNESNPLKSQALNNIVTADKFGILPLKSLALEKFSASVGALWNEPVFPEIAKAAMTLVPTHETTLQEMIAAIIFNHITRIIPAMMDTLNSFGSISSLILTKLILDKRIREPGVSQDLVPKLNTTHECRFCSEGFNVSLKDGEYQPGTFRCVACRTQH